MSKIDDGGAAFATPAVNYSAGDYVAEGQPGLSSRDYFAAAALPTIIALADASFTTAILAKQAFAIADALIAASKSSEPGHE